MSFLEGVQGGRGKEIVLEESGSLVLVPSQLNEIGDGFSATRY